MLDTSSEIVIYEETILLLGFRLWCLTPLSIVQYILGLFLAIVETSSGFRSSCYWTNWNRANAENIRIGLGFVVLAQWKFIYLIDRFDHIKLINQS
jgi:hypothetical protein